MISKHRKFTMAGIACRTGLILFSLSAARALRAPVVPLTGTPPPPPIPAPLPQPVTNVIPPPQQGAAAVLEFATPVPPPPLPLQFWPAQGVRVYKLDLPNEVDLNDLMGGSPAVPEAPQPAEMEWKLLQYNPNRANSGVLHNRGARGHGAHSVVRRYGHDQYTGYLDPLTHEALCADPTCSAPGAGELGDIVGAQNAAANLERPLIAVTNVGSGIVDAGGPINCGGVCSANLTAGANATLTANPPSNAVFNGWSGACTGNQQTCGFTVKGAMETTATSTTAYADTRPAGLPFTWASSPEATRSGPPLGAGGTITCSVATLAVGQIIVGER